jgi:hypothetical protein
VKAGAFEQSSMDLDGGGIAVGQNNSSPEAKTQTAGIKSNGHAQNGGKKRKADKISSE